MENNIPVLGYEGFYEASPDGWIYSVKSGKKLMGGLDKDGYRMVLLYKPETPRKLVKVHREIAKTFIPNPLNKPTVNHHNGKLDNSVPSLSWMTVKEQNLFKFTNGEQVNTGANNAMATTTETQALLVIYLFADGLSRKAISNKVGVSYDVVKQILNGSTWKHLPRFVS